MSAFVVSASVFVGLKSKRPLLRVVRFKCSLTAPLSTYIIQYVVIVCPRYVFAYCVLLHVRLCCVAAQMQEKAMKLISVLFIFCFCISSS